MSFDVVSAARVGRSLDLDVDDVVVGSGAAGAVVACLLAESGRNVVVLEEGPQLRASEIESMRPSQHLRKAWRDGGMTVAVGLGGGPSINVTMGRAVGGSSMLTGGVCFRTPAHVLDDWSHRLGLKGFAAQELEPHFEEVERAINVEEVPASLRSLSTKKFIQGAEKLGLVIEPLRRNTRGCNGCGRCNFGCPHGAKLSVDYTYLPRAVAAGARIFSDVLVNEVVIEDGRAQGVSATIVDRTRSLFRRAQTVKVRAKRVVLAAGATHTPLILARSAVRDRSRQIGRNMTLHPAFRMFARFDERLDGWRGALQSAYSRSLEHEGITLVGLFVPPGVLAATMPGFGNEHVRRASDIPHLAVFGGMIHDEGGGAVRRGPGREPIFTYDMSETDKQRIPNLIRKMGDAFFAAGAREVFPPILGQAGLTADAFRAKDFSKVPGLKLECSSQHPLGSARMGVSADSSVVQSSGETWGARGLYVVDGSVVPTSLGVNPQLTIMALATRIARGMISGNAR